MWEGEEKGKKKGTSKKTVKAKWREIFIFIKKEVGHSTTRGCETILVAWILHVSRNTRSFYSLSDQKNYFCSFFCRFFPLFDRLVLCGILRVRFSPLFKFSFENIFCLFFKVEISLNILLAILTCKFLSQSHFILKNFLFHEGLTEIHREVHLMFIFLDQERVARGNDHQFQCVFPQQTISRLWYLNFKCASNLIAVPPQTHVSNHILFI